MKRNTATPTARPRQLLKLRTAPEVEERFNEEVTPPETLPVEVEVVADAGAFVGVQPPILPIPATLKAVFG